MNVNICKLAPSQVSSIGLSESSISRYLARDAPLSFSWPRRKSQGTPTWIAGPPDWPTGKTRFPRVLIVRLPNSAGPCGLSTWSDAVMTPRARRNVGRIQRPSSGVRTMVTCEAQPFLRGPVRRVATQPAPYVALENIPNVRDRSGTLRNVARFFHLGPQ